MQPSYFIKEPFELKPLIISIPHCGTAIPDRIRSQLNPLLAQNLPDTDWFVHDLYSFGPRLGATLLYAHYSRYVVDLNRPRQGGKLYQDGRQESGLIPTHSFQGEPLYGPQAPDTADCEKRLEEFYDPYHLVLAERIDFLRQRFNHVLLIEGHSIARYVPRLYPKSLPDLMLGSSDGHSADPKLVEIALRSLQQIHHFSVSLNEPFKGGFITRHYGRPHEGIHALQLEMSQDLYLDSKGMLDKKKAGPLIATLELYITNLLQCIEAM